jgi:copper chaperone NosL
VRRRALIGLAAWVAIGIGACGGDTPPQAAPPAVEVTADATGRYCGMLLSAHEGPKGQVHLDSKKDPVWFTSVRDTLAFMRLPEEPRDITAVYVNDMGRSAQWEQPDAGAWVDPREAWFVIESDMRGGMGAPEAVPFSQESAARAFQSRNKGRVVRFAEIPDAYVLGPVNLEGPGAAPRSTGEATSGASR